MSSQELPLAFYQLNNDELPTSDSLAPSSPSKNNLSASTSMTMSDAALPSHTVRSSELREETSISDNNLRSPTERDPQLDKRPNPRLTALNNKKAKLESTLADLQAQRTAYISQSKLPSGLNMPSDWSDEQKATSALESANSVIKEHIALLHSYNEIKDIGQGLLGIVAEQRGVRVAAVMEDYGMDQKD